MKSQRMAPAVMLALLGGCSVSVHTSSGWSGGPEAAARRFLQRIVADGTAAAYAAAAPQMRAAVGPNAFRAMALSFGLDRFQSVAFADSQTTSDGTTLLTGTIYEQGKLGMPVKVRAIANQGEWQIVSLDLTQTATHRVGEGAAEPGIGLGTKIVTAEEMAASCRRIAAPLRVPICVHSVPFANGSSSECLGATPSRMVGITATLSDVNYATGTMNVSCRVTD